MSNGSLRAQAETLFRQANTYEPTQPRNVYRQASLDVIFAQVWTRSGLTRRQRRFVTLPAIGMRGGPVGRAAQVYGALNSNDISVDEMGELLLHFACYAGFPAAAELDAAVGQALARIASERGEQPPQRGFAELLPQRLEELVDGAGQTRLAVLGDAADGSSAAGPLATAFEYGQVWSRPQLPRSDRRLITLTCLAVQGDDDALLQAHLAAARTSGDLDDLALGELAFQVGFYAGLSAGRRIDAAVARA